MQKKTAIILLAIIVILAGVFMIYLFSVMAPIGRKAEITPAKKISQPMTVEERQGYIEDNLITIPVDLAEAKARQEYIGDNVVTIPMDPAEAKARQEYIEDNVVTIPIDPGTVEKQNPQEKAVTVPVDPEEAAKRQKYINKNINN